jgi:uncharacterized protein (DUF488 family)
MASPATASDKSQGTGIRQLTNTVLGRALSMNSLFELLEKVGIDRLAAPTEDADEVWVGSVGYENHREVDAFAEMVASAGVKRLVDVRELPISRKRGFAKTALSEALDRAGVEYVHLKALGNPKVFRDLYKSGEVESGRKGYKRFLLKQRLDVLASLETLLQEKRSALMCVENDQSICHRDVILEALRVQRKLNLEVAQIG